MESMALEVGSRLGHYDVIALIGEGGMGQVYRTDYVNLDRSPWAPRLANGDPAELRRRERRSRDVSRDVLVWMI